jgi:hypothetical protein
MNWIEYRIQEAKEKRLPQLDLSRDAYLGAQNAESLDVLTEFPREILDISHLVRLDLSGHSLREVPIEICRLENLEDFSVASH